MKLTEYPKNKIVFTTKSVVKENAPIFYISLDKDGDFQMFGNEEQDVNNAILVSLGQIIEMDKTLLNLSNIEIGEAYIRDNKESEWKIFNK